MATLTRKLRCAHINVIEAEGTWDSRVSAGAAVDHNQVIVAAKDDTPSELALRVIHAIQRLPADVRLSELSICVGRQWQEHNYKARSQMVGAAFRAMAAQGGRVVLRLPAAAAPEARVEAFELASVLIAQLRSSDIEVSILLEQPKQSGPTPRSLDAGAQTAA